jgi:two-component system, NtrC family, nitrogen regulation sensor histidine kinase NtrY
MGFNLKLTLHIGGLLLTMMLLVWVWQNTAYYATLFTLSLILLVQVGGLIKLVSTTNRELSRFLNAVKYADFSQSFQTTRKQHSFRELGAAFDGVIERLRSERSAKEEQATYLQAFVQQLPIAVLALHEDGRIAVSNQALQRLLNGRVCHHLQQLKEFDSALGEFLERVKPGREQNFKLKRPYGTLQLKVSCTLLRMRGQQQKLISLQDISSDLETQELEAWHNLIRVMTHEIMNSLTPLTSLADTARHYIDEAREQLTTLPSSGKAASATHTQASATLSSEGKLDHATLLALLDDAASATTTIGKRGQALLRFVQSYRTLSRLPAPRIKTFQVQEVLHSVNALMRAQAADKVLLHCHCTPMTLELQADPELLEQALINLVKNALDAVADVPQPTITLSAELRELGQIALSVTDNGCGMDSETLSQIFVPFFTTKRGGSGIGMTLVRQIVHLNNGNIHVESSPAQGTRVLLVF